MISAIHKSLAKKRAMLENDDKGFTLIELLVVVLIIGILAAIAIPVFLGQQNAAKDSAAKSDLTNAKIALSALASQNNGALTGLVAEADMKKNGFTPTAGTYAISFRGAADGSFCLNENSSTTKLFVATDSSAPVEGVACVVATYPTLLFSTATTASAPAS